MASSHSTKPNQPTLHTLNADPLTPFNRLHIFLYSFAIVAFLYHRITSLNYYSNLLLLLADVVFLFMWALSQAFRWRPVRRQEYPDRLREVVDNNKDLPALDVFICTADPWKEPPMNVVSTALSVMAFDYPAEKLSVYVSDDGGSDLTLFAFMEAAKFAKYWLPFCRENGINETSPIAYFESSKRKSGSSHNKMKMMYKTVKEKVECAMEKGYIVNDLVMAAEEYEVFNKWKEFTRQDHPSVIQVLVDSSTDSDIMGKAMPNLVYVSREKRPTSAHHFKAGALNALIRVSCILTNAPVILTLDCDMYSNDPKTPRRALCYILDPALSSKLSFIQFPQRYQGLNKNDIYGGELKHVFRINARGADGLQGTNLVGTGCFFMRRSLYGPPTSAPGQFTLHLKEYSTADSAMRSESVMKRANEVAGCNSELGTKWGALIGFRYGSLVEDYNTSYHLHCQGWKSVFCDPKRPAFLGDAPKNLNDVLGQCTRWVVGLLEVCFSKYNPLLFGTRKASFLMGICYAYYAFWGIWCIPITIYAVLPQLALIYDVPLFPKLSDPWFYLYAYLFLAAYCQDLIEFLIADGTIQRWWSAQRIWLIRGLTSFTFGTIQFAINQMGLSTPGFTLTSKVTDDGQNERYENGVFDFGVASPFFVLLGTVGILNLSSFTMGIVKSTRKEGGYDEMFVQMFLSGFDVANCWPILEAMFARRDGGKVPKKVTNISICLAGLICILGYFALAG